MDECQTEKPCDQQCINTHGSYFCRCRQGFVLQSDQQSCKKVSTNADDAFEARDLENDIDDTDAEVATRLQKIEKSLANERVHTNELQKSLQATYSVVDTLKSRLSTLVRIRVELLYLNIHTLTITSYALRKSRLRMSVDCRRISTRQSPGRTSWRVC